MFSGLLQFRYHKSHIAFLVMFLALWVDRLPAQAGFSWKYEQRALGAADLYGYCIWTTPLANLTLGKTTIPLRAEFTSDPRPEPSPSPLGKGWVINLFSSALVEVDQYSIRWHRPDGRIFYFNLERGNTSTKKTSPDAPIVFKSKDHTWIALKTPKNRLVTLIHQESGAELVYEDGLLTLFFFDKSADDTEQYVISYNRLRRPTRLTLRGTGKIMAEFFYDDANRAKEFRVGDAGDPLANVISFEYTKASLTKFPSGPYLSKLVDKSLTLLAISYVPQPGNANRVQFERLNSTDVNYVTWDAVSGFVLDDQSSTYKIENPSLASEGRPVPDTKIKPAKIPDGEIRQPKVADYNWSPDEAKITRTDRHGKVEFRFYDRSKGILTSTDKNGVSTLTHYLLTPGPMMNKVRKVEEIRGTLFTVLIRNAYDELGRKTREITPKNTTMWEYNASGGFLKFINGAIVEELQLSDGVEVHKLYTAKGVLEKSTKNVGGALTIGERINGVIVSEVTTTSNRISANLNSANKEFTHSTINPLLLEPK